MKKTNQTRFGIEWIYGEFRIARFRHKKCAEIWMAPYEVHSLSELSRAMQDASKCVDLKNGGDVAIAYEDDLHSHQFVEVPDLVKRDLEKYLKRRVEREKPFEGDAAWCYHKVMHDNTNKGVLLHMMPKKTVDAVIRICEEYGLKPRLMVPLTEVMSEHVPTFHADADDTLLVVSIFNNRAQMIICRSDGDILFVRELTFSWKNDNIERLITEINRTIGYSKQRIGSSLTKVWVIGEYAPQLIDKFQERLNAPVEIEKEATDPAFWINEVSCLSQRLSSNFIPKLVRNAITRKAFVRAAVVAAMSISFVTFFITLIIEGLLIKHGIDRSQAENKIIELDEKIAVMQNGLKEIKWEQERLDHLTADSFNLPAVFLNHLGNLIPEGVTLKRAGIMRAENHWDVELNGVSELPLSALPPVLIKLESKLSAEPWNTQITQSWQKVWMEQLKSGGATNNSSVGFEVKGRLY